MVTSAAPVSLAEHPLAEQLREVAGVWARSQQQLVTLAADFADSAEWVFDGSPTPAHWISHVADVEECTAREWIRIGRRLRDLPEISSAFAAGKVSYSKVRTLTRVATPENETELLDIALRVPAGQLGRAIATWMKREFDPAELAAYHKSRRSVRWRTEPDGMVLFTLRLPPFLAGKLISVLMAIVMRYRPNLTDRGRRVAQSGAAASAGAWPSLAQQYCDALDHLLDEGTGAIESEIVVHIRGDGCTLDDGTPIPDTVVAEIATDSFIRALIHDADGKPINASGRQRHPTTRQKRVVKERDKACADCGTTDGPLVYDHVPAFETSHRTIVDELHLRCAPCHNLRHRGTD